MAHWHSQIRGQPEGNVFWFEDPEDWDSFEAVTNRQVRFIFFLEAHRDRRPERPMEILQGEVARLDELVVQRAGICRSIDDRARAWVSEDDAGRFRHLLTEWYGGRLKVIEVSPILVLLGFASPPRPDTGGAC